MACNDCPELNPNPNEGCLQPINSSCVTYDGNDVDCADIASGQTISQVIETLANNDCELQEQLDDLEDDLQELSGVVLTIEDKIQELSGNQYEFSCEELSECELNSLGNVDTNPVSGDSIIFNGEKWINYTPEQLEPYQFSCEELSGCSIDDLADVELSNEMSGDTLIHNGMQFVNIPFIDMLSGVQSLIDNLTTQLQIQSNLLSLYGSRLDVCCVPEELDVELSGSTVDICFQISGSGKLFGEFYTIGSGTDFGSFDGMVSVTVYASDSSDDLSVTRSYIPPKSSFVYGLGLTQGIKAAIMSPVGLNTRTISAIVRFKDSSNVLNFAEFTANIPQLTTNGECSFGNSTTFTINELF